MREAGSFNWEGGEDWKLSLKEAIALLHQLLDSIGLAIPLSITALLLDLSGRSFHRILVVEGGEKAKNSNIFRNRAWRLFCSNLFTSDTGLAGLAGLDRSLPTARCLLCLARGSRYRTG